jgi:8-oxo-dGTP diphosphatase
MAQRLYRAAVEICVWRDGKLLAVNNRKWGKYSCPGGKIEEGEEPEAAAARELLEETGCKALTLKRIAGNTHKPMKHDPANVTWFCLAFEATIGDQEPKEAEEGTKPFWTTPEDLKETSLFPDWYAWLFNDLRYTEGCFNFAGPPGRTH